jgi:hypothetical protein
MGYIDREGLLSLTKQFGKGHYGRYLETLAHQQP